MTSLTVSYSCTACGIVDAAVSVPCRAAEDDLMVWMKDLGVFLRDDHEVRSPYCRPKSFQDVKIPINEGPGNWVGAPVTGKKKEVTAS